MDTISPTESAATDANPAVTPSITYPSMDIPQSTSPVEVTPPAEDIKPKKPSSVLPVILLLVIATLISAGVSWFILTQKTTTTDMSQNNQPSPSTQDNPFITEPAENPFLDEANLTGNPFEEEESENPFDLFDTEATTSAGNDQYQNPF